MKLVKFVTGQGKIEYRKYKFMEDWQIEKVAKARKWTVVAITNQW